MKTIHPSQAFSNYFQIQITWTAQSLNFEWDLLMVLNLHNFTYSGEKTLLRSYAEWDYLQDLHSTP